jgi:zinc transport system substrate-binding protein
MLRGTTNHACVMSLLALLAIGCSTKDTEQAPADTDERPATVYTVNYPLAYFAQRLAPENVQVVFPAPPDVDPAFWKPAPDAVGQFQSASLLLLNGAGYARWIRHATLPKSRIVVTADGCREPFLPARDTVTHQHGPDGEHAHEGTAFTTWLDLRLALCQASHIREALIQLSPTNEDPVHARFKALEHELTQLDTRLRAAAKTWRDQPMLGSHPVYQYLADAYEIRIESMHFEPDEALTPEDLQAIDALLERHPAKLMLWEAQPLPQAEQQLRDRGITSIVFDPAAQPPGDGDFLTVMTGNVKRLTCATGAEACQ